MGAPVVVSYDCRAVQEPVCLPGSKSIAARALVSRFVRGLDTRLVNLPSCDDTRELAGAVAALAEAYPHAAALIREYGELPPREMCFNLGNGATTLRYFLALAASMPGLVAHIDCGEGLRRRPLKPLIDELRAHGAEISCHGMEGYAPLTVFGRRLAGGDINADTSVSSQFVSALMLASPLWSSPIGVLPSAGVSAPYITMTRKVMERFDSSPAEYVIESDWSAASYFYELAMACPGREIMIDSLTLPEVSLQGDAMCQQLFGWLGVETRRLDGNPDGPAELCGIASRIADMRSLNVPVCFDLGKVPDLTPAIAVALCMAGLPFDLSGIAHLRFKECDRIAALSTEMDKAGYAVAGNGDSLLWSGRRLPVADDETFSSWNDHRMVMALAMLAVNRKYVAIKDAEVVAKSFPDFFAQLRRLGFDVRIPGSGRIV